MAGRIMGTVELEPLVTLSGDDPNLCWTSAAIIHRTLKNQDPFISSRVVIFGALLFQRARSVFFFSGSVAGAIIKRLPCMNFFMSILISCVISAGPNKACSPVGHSLTGKDGTCASCPSTRRIVSRHWHQIRFAFLRHPARHGRPRHCEWLWWAS